MTGVHRNTGYCNTCYIGEQEIAISVDGNFFPCSRLVGVGDEPAYVFGNVQQGIDRARQHFIIARSTPPPRGTVTKPAQLKLRTSIHHFAPLTSYPELASYTLFTIHFFIIPYSLQKSLGVLQHLPPKVPWGFATLTPKSPLGFCNTYFQKSLGVLQISIDNQ